MGYVNDPRKNIHKIYTKEMIINPYAFGKSTPAILNDGNTVAWWDFTDLSKIELYASGNDIKTVNPVIAGQVPLAGDAGVTPTWSINGALFDGGAASLRNSQELLVSPPFIIYYVMRQISIIPNRYNMLLSGSNAFQNGQEPNTNRMYMYDGSNVIYDGYMPLNTFSIIKLACYSGGDSFASINENKTLGSVVGGITDITVGKHVSNQYASNIEVKEMIIRRVIETSQNESDIYAYLKTKYRL